MEDFLNWELTNRMHNLGYDGKTLMYIDDEGDIINDDSAELIGAKPAILTSAAFRWFREKYKIHGILYPYSETVSGKFGWVIFFIGKTKDGHVTEMIRSPRPLCSMVDREAGDDSYWDFEEAELACLDKLLEIVEKTEK